MPKALEKCFYPKPHVSKVLAYMNLSEDLDPPPATSLIENLKIEFKNLASAVVAFKMAHVRDQKYSLYHNWNRLFNFDLKKH